ncbi:MAG: thiamine-phosphate kinase [Spirosomataceae bacterium]
MNRTELNQLGEFGLIQRLAQSAVLRQPSSVKGIGDDAAVLEISPTHYQLVSTDLLLEGVHFDLSYVPLKHLGYKAVAVNVSDIAAMNGIPQQITVSIGLSNRFSVEAVEELYAGIYAACEAYHVDLVGGDTSSSRAGLVLSITAVGTVEKEKIAYRNGAKPNDLVCVTGDLGAAYLGLQLLEREKQVFLTNPAMQPQLDGNTYLLQRQLRPEARTDVVHELHELGVVPTSMIDVSDGLASDLLHLCTQSGTGVRIVEENLPIDDQTYLAATDLNLSPLTAALNGGEDYELLFTIQQKDYEKIKNVSEVSVIGYMTADPTVRQIITKAGQAFSLQAQGWNHLFDSN